MPGFDPSCIDVADFLDCLDIRNVRRATEREFQFSCPFPAHATGDERPSAYMNVNTTAYMCHSCHAKGNAVTFAADLLRVSPIEATRMLKQRYSPGGIDPDSRDMLEEIRKIIALRNPPERRENRILNESVLNKYLVHWQAIWDGYQNGHALVDFAQYMIANRGFSPATLDDWQFGFDSRTKRITLPVRDEHGRLVGVKARAMDGRKPKYLNLRDEDNDVESFLKNDVVFGLDRARDERIHLIVVEGEFNVVAMHAFGFKNTVAINGSYYGQRQIKLLKMYADEVTLFFDSDSAGKDATEALVEELRQYLRVYVCPEHWGDPADMGERSVRACLNARISAVEYRLAAIRETC